MLSGDPATTFQSSDVPTLQDTVVFSAELGGAGAQATLVAVTEQSPDTGSSTSGAISAVFFTMLPNLTILIHDTHHSLNAQL